jgi:hypothetical protein
MKYNYHKLRLIISAIALLKRQATSSSSLGVKLSLVNPYGTRSGAIHAAGRPFNSKLASCSCRAVAFVSNSGRRELITSITRSGEALNSRRIEAIINSVESSTPFRFCYNLREPISFLASCFPRLSSVTSTWA